MTKNGESEQKLCFRPAFKKFLVHIGLENLLGHFGLTSIRCPTCRAHTHWNIGTKKLTESEEKFAWGAGALQINLAKSITP